MLILGRDMGLGGGGGGGGCKCAMSILILPLTLPKKLEFENLVGLYLKSHKVYRVDTC